MELTNLRRIKNTKELPGFNNGGFLADQYGGWQQTPQFYGSSARSIFDPTTLSAEMPTVKDLGIPSSGTVMPLKATPDQAKLITGDTSAGHNFDNGLQSLKDSGKTSPIKMEQVSGIVPAAIGFGTDVYGATKYDKGQAELLSEGNRSQQSVDGIGYEAYGGVNQSQFNKDVSSKKTANTLKTMGSGAALGAALGSVIPGLGTVFGGIAGGLVGGAAGLIAGGAMEREAERKRRLANISGAIKTEDNRSDASTTALQLRANQNDQNPQAQLRGWRDGRATDAGGWGRLSSGEVLVHGDQIIDRMPGLPNFKDGIVAYVGDAGVVSNHKVGGIRNSDYVMATGDVKGGLIRDMFWRKEHGKEYKNGKLPGFKEGYLGNLIPSGLGMLASVGQYLDASSQDLRSPQIYSANPYEQSALNDLAGLRINQYPIINQINNATARADYALNKSGGLSGYQRSRLRTANLYNTQKNISDTLMNAQMQNNQYRANLANAKMQLGSQYAQRMQQSRMFNEEMLAKAHAARQQGKQMGMFNFLNQLQSYYANEFKRRQFNDTMDLYRQQQNLDKARFDSELARYNDSKKQGVYLTPNQALPMMNMLLKYYGVG